MESLLCFVLGVTAFAWFQVAWYIFHRHYIGYPFNIVALVALAVVVIMTEIYAHVWAAKDCARRLGLPAERIRALVADPWILRPNVWACQTEADVIQLETHGTWPWPRTPVPGAKKGK
jgi:hypothetical protein